MIQGQHIWQSWEGCIYTNEVTFSIEYLLRSVQEMTVTTSVVAALIALTLVKVVLKKIADRYRRQIPVHVHALVNFSF